MIKPKKRTVESQESLLHSLSDIKRENNLREVRIRAGEAEQSLALAEKAAELFPILHLVDMDISKADRIEGINSTLLKIVCFDETGPDLYRVLALSDTGLLSTLVIQGNIHHSPSIYSVKAEPYVPAHEGEIGQVAHPFEAEGIAATLANAIGKAREEVKRRKSRLLRSC